MSLNTAEGHFEFIIWSNEYYDWANWHEAFEEDYSDASEEKKYQLMSELNQSMTVETEKALLELITDIRRELMLPHKQSKKEIIGAPAKPALWGEEDPRSAEHLPLAANGKDGG